MMGSSEVDMIGLSEQAETTYGGFTHLMLYGAIATFIAAMIVVFIIAT